MSNKYPVWTRCPQCNGQAYVQPDDGSTLLFCAECGYHAHIKLANLLFKRTTQRKYATIMPQSE